MKHPANLRSIATYGLAAAAGVAALAIAAPVSAAWEPTRPVEFIVPAGTGGGADQMARVIQGIVTKHKLMKQSMVVVNKSGGAGGEGFLDVKGAKGNPHKIVITLSNLFTTPLATGIPFNWKDLTPVAMMALDEFVLWVHAERRTRPRQDYIAAVKAAPGTMQDGRHRLQAGRPDHHGRAREGDRREVHLHSRTRAAARSRCSSSASTSTRASTTRSRRWRSGAPGSCEPLCVFDGQNAAVKDKITGDMSWGDIPTCKSQGLDIEYLMLRGIFMTPGATPDQVAFYVDLLKKVRETPEWKELMEDGAFNQTFMTGADYAKWVEKEENRHRDLMKAAGFLATTN